MAKAKKQRIRKINERLKHVTQKAYQDGFSDAVEALKCDNQTQEILISALESIAQIVGCACREERRET